jgi:hypothetical protein
MMRRLEGLVFWTLAMIMFFYLGARLAIWLVWLVTRWIFSPGSVQG